MLDSIQKPNSSVQKPKSRFRLVLALVMLMLLTGGIFLGSKLVLLAQKIMDGQGTKFSLRKLFIAGDQTLVGEGNGQIHILLMGIGGAEHEGGTLTDTLILATLKLPEKDSDAPRIGLVSIPRDLVVNIPGYDFRKINSAYAFGQAGDKDQGPALAVRTVEQVFDLDIPYYVVVDFAGFKKVVDDLGGIEINVEEGFTDSQYPDTKLGYLPPLTFSAGRHKMDGDRALQYVRSRHGNNNQGSDFARSRRQQAVLKAVKDQITSLRVLTNLNLVDRLLEDLSDHVRLNLAPHEIRRLYGLTKNISSQNITALAIDNESGLVCDQIAEDTGAYMLVPCAGLGNYHALRDAVEKQFLYSSLQDEQPVIEIQNASGIANLGSAVQNSLGLPFLKITASNFTGQAVYRESVVYDNTNGRKKAALEFLQKRLNLKVASSPFPFATVAAAPDFVIVVASDLNKKQ